jgi:hypothetical protein
VITPRNNAEHQQQLRTVSAGGLTKLKTPEGKRINYLQVRAELDRRKKAAGTTGHPQESKAHKAHVREMAKRHPIHVDHEPRTKQEATHLASHPRSRTGTKAKPPATPRKSVLAAVKTAVRPNKGMTATEKTNSQIPAARAGSRQDGIGFGRVVKRHWIEDQADQNRSVEAH